MKTIFDNDVCIILNDDLTFHPEHSNTSRVTGFIGFDRLIHAHEVWVYKPQIKRFHAYKNKGYVNEAIQRMAKLGINVRAFAASSDSHVSQLRFETSKDLFHFNLKFE